MDEFKEALKKFKKIRSHDAAKIASTYCITVFCNTCGERVGRVKQGSDRVDILCWACGDASDAFMKAVAYEQAQTDKKNKKR
jgi:hypothetical protein